MPVYSRFHFGATSSRFTSRSGSLNGSGRRKRPLKMLKMTTFPAMPSASVTTTTAVNPGFFSSWRNAKRRSFISQRLHRIDFRRPTRAQQTRQQRHARQQQGHSDKGQRIHRADTIEQAAEQTRRREGTGEPSHETSANQLHPAPKDH